MHDTQFDLALLPHRYPFLLVDRIDRYEAGKSASGIKAISANDPYVTRLFPDCPIMPGTLLIEMMAQVGTAVLLGVPAYRGSIPMIVGMERVRFRRVVRPGDQVRTDVCVLRARRASGRMRGTLWCEDLLVAEGEFLYVMVESPDGKSISAPGQE